MNRREKLKTYFTGFGIGLILVGFLIYTRWKFANVNAPPPQPQQQQQQAP